MLKEKAQYLGTLQRASYDQTNDVSLIEDEKAEVYLLDEVAKDIAREYEMDTPSSCDSLLIHEKELFVMEFKNRAYGAITSKDKREIRKKAYQTPAILLNSFLREQTMEDLALNATLIIVFKNMQEKDESFGKLSDKLNQLANGNKKRIRCGLGRFKGAFYKNVCTIGKEEFESQYLPFLTSSGNDEILQK